MSEPRFPVEMVNGVPIVAAPEEIDITNADELRAAVLQAASSGDGTFVVDMSRTSVLRLGGAPCAVDAHKRAQGDRRPGAAGRVRPGRCCAIFQITGVDTRAPALPGRDGGSRAPGAAEASGAGT